MEQETLDRVNRFYARSLGCKPATMESPRSGVFTRGEKTGYSEDQKEKDVDVFVRKGEKIVSCDPEVLPRIRELERYLPDLKLSKKSLERKG